MNYPLIAIAAVCSTTQPHVSLRGLVQRHDRSEQACSALRDELPLEDGLAKAGDAAPR